MKKSFKLASPQARSMAVSAVQQAPNDYTVEVKPDNRTTQQNRLLWPLLTDLSKQVQWFIGGSMQYLTPDDWKDVMTASLNGEQRLSQGTRGGLVLLGARTSKMTKKEFGDLIDFIFAFGNEKGVRWSQEVEIPGWMRD